MIFDGWNSILRTLIVGVLAYGSVVALVRISGKRTLSKMNAFDLIVTVALGSTLATILLSRDVALLTGIAALAILILMQYVVAWLSVRSGMVRRLAKSEPRLLVRGGQLLEHAMREERVTRDEILAAIRSQGHSGLEQVDALILETDGTMSVVPSNSMESDAALRTLRGYEGGSRHGRRPS